jgi:hypothetical protein
MYAIGCGWGRAVMMMWLPVLGWIVRVQVMVFRSKYTAWMQVPVSIEDLDQVRSIFDCQVMGGWID